MTVPFGPRSFFSTTLHRTMYEPFFGLSERPFAASPNTDRYYPAAPIEDARGRLAQAIERGEGPGLVVGPAGCGKTLLCHVLAGQFQATFHIAHLEAARLCSRRALLQAILFELGLPYRDMAEGELRLSLIDHLAPSDECPNGMLLLIDEAHTLPLRLLDEVRMITNLVRDGEPRARAVLVGAPALEEHFANPKLDSFNQRLAARCYLQAFDKHETFEYVRAQVAASGAEPDAVFTDAAIDAVHRATDGIPRLVNQLCDHALIVAVQEGARPLKPLHIEQAWADLQQLPTPWSTDNRADAPNESADVIEFGSLDALDDVEASSDATFVAETTIDFDQIDAENASAGAAVIASTLVDSGTSVLHIEDHADDVDEDLPTVASIATAIVPSTTTADPFDEEFAEEEIIIDRYAMLEDSGLPARSPLPSSADMAIVHAIDQAQRTLPAVHTVESPAAVALDQSPSADDDHPAEPTEVSPAAYDPVLPEPDTPPVDPGANPAIYHRLDRFCKIPAPKSRSRARHDVLVIEDEPV